ncbi:DUF447 domain-containing protein [Arenibaculum pallidiluteum]|uniref:DUF447 domain-containing protein n=1 Tax=Arenibaculum pallidiluteum TaxID=2812559 RepID=UPI001A96481C|nr:DUF447 domain-containing protein [Arenibaculum pallidiluteum]
MPLIRETIVTTRSAAGIVHVAPMGVTVLDEGVYLLAPFRPSRTLDNLLETRCAVINHTDDVRVFAGCVTGRRRDWPTGAARHVAAPVLAGALSHEEVEVVGIEEDPARPRLTCRLRHVEVHRAATGHNRAQAAVIEAAILATRLHLLPPEKVEREVAYLTIAVEKTAGPLEAEAWGWIMDMLARHRGQVAV